MIDNSLTVKIEKDLYDTTGKKPPKQVNRLGSNPVNYSPVATSKSRPYSTMAKTTGGKNASKKTNLDMRLHAEFGIQMGNKFFRNEKFE